VPEVRVKTVRLRAVAICSRVVTARNGAVRVQWDQYARGALEVGVTSLTVTIKY
jgi:hypothetical protein